MKLAIAAPRTVALLMLVAACGGGGDSTAPVSTRTVVAIAFSGTTFSLQAGETSVLAATARDSVGHTIAGRTFTWTSRTPSVVTVAGNGTLTAVATGSAVVEARVGAVSDSITVIVISRVASIVISPQAPTVEIPAHLQLTLILLDANHVPITGAGIPVTWTTSDLTKATINPTGNVTPVTVGTCVITARFVTGSFPALTATTNLLVVQRVGG